MDRSVDRPALARRGPCERRPGGRGDHLWIRNVTITTGLVDTRSTQLLLDMLAAGRLDVSGLATHRFGLGELQEAYDVFGAAGQNGALKVALFRA